MKKLFYGIKIVIIQNKSSLNFEKFDYVVIELMKKILLALVIMCVSIRCNPDIVRVSDNNSGYINTIDNTNYENSWRYILLPDNIYLPMSFRIGVDI